jgi:hypothetical protein
MPLVRKMPAMPLVVGAVAGVVLLAATWVTVWLLHEARPDFPVWLEAISTFSAFVAASAAVVFAARVYELERGRDERWDRERRSAQAEQVAAWWDYEAKCVLVRNQSTLPVSDLVIRLELNGTPATVTHRVLYLAPLETVRVEERDFLTAAELTTRGRRPEVLMDWMPPTHEEPARTVRYSAEVAFRDTAGRRWTRSFDGTLTAASES